MNDCENLIRPALSNALDSFKIERDGTSCKVVTPFQHSNGDLVRLWVQSKSGDKFLIRDYGETYAMLELYGVDPTSRSQRKRIDYIHNQFELDPEGDELRSSAMEGELGERVVAVIQAIMAVSYLVYKHQTQQPSRFRTKVANFLDEVGYDYDTEYGVDGQNQRRVFDVAINHREPAVLLDTVHTTDQYYLRQLVDGVMVNWYEIQHLNYRHGVIVDDKGGVSDGEVLETLEEKLDFFFRWSHKSDIEEEIPVTVK